MPSGSRSPQPPFGVLNINKPVGWTSRDVINRVERRIRPAKAGHAGTLDPLATGVLLVCVGAATRLIDFAQRMPKRYRATFMLGRRSPTDDIESEVEVFDVDCPPDSQALAAAIPQFIGRIQQRPPAFSAVKVKGRRAYTMARRGEQPLLPTRPVTIHSLDVVRFEYPELILDVKCGSGTYIRALGRDLAAALNTAAVMTALERIAIASFTSAAAMDVDQLVHENLRECLLPPASILTSLPRLELGPAEAAAVRHGQHIRHARHLTGQLELPGDAYCAEAAAFDPQGDLVAIMAPTGQGRWRPLRTFPPIEPAARYGT